VLAGALAGPLGARATAAALGAGLLVAGLASAGRVRSA
jgi:hypothetical protein